MAQAASIHAWLFQFRPADDSEWLERLKNEKKARWRIIRWARETNVDDLVFFWESGKSGGLRGWGLVSEEPDEGKTAKGRTVWRVPVRVLHWLDVPISRSAVIAAGVLNPNHLYLNMPQGANFRLEPDEAEKMLTLMPDTPVPFGRLQALLPHPARQEDSERIDDTGFGNEDDDELPRIEMLRDFLESPETEYDLDDVVPASDFTPLGRDILDQAAFRSERLLGPISSTRLFIAIFEWSGQQSAKDLAIEDEKAAIDLMRAVVERHRSALNRMRTNYMRDQKRARVPVRPRITGTIRNLLTHAKAGELAKAKNGKIGFDDLLVAIFTVDAGRLPERLEGVDLSLQQLKSEIVYEDHAGSETFSGELDRLRGRSRAGAPRALGPTRLQVPAVRNDNPWQEGQKDVLGAEREAQAFAALALSPSFVPPLAVGVFGEWGSGKSFFMRLAHENIQRLSDRAREQGEKASLLGRVVQIRFNAWHYVDTNLWASLVDHIFTELDRATSAKQRSKSEQLFAQLATARELTLESAETLIARRKEQEDAALLVARSQRLLDEAEHRANLSPQTYWNAVKTDFLKHAESTKAELTKVVDALGLPRVETDIRPFVQALEQLSDDRQRAIVLAEGLKRQLGSWTMVGVFAVACVIAPMAIWYVRDCLANVVDFIDIRSAISEGTVWLSGLLTAGAVVFAEASRRVRQAINVAQSFRNKLDEAAARVLAKPSFELESQQKELARLNAQVEEGKSRLAASTQRLSQAAGEYNTGTGRARLLSFVRARAAGDSYARHLGLVATIRKDFEELSELIAAAIDSGSRIASPSPTAGGDLQDYMRRVESLIADATADDRQLLQPEEQKKLRSSAEVQPLDQSDSIDRIVLFIDDLDRCQPQKVAEVLQAVHLLLSFKLFIVFVAVDVRWVGKALQKHYPMLASGSAGNGSATAHDYLEKIFQVPYWVRPMSQDASADFMRDRLTQSHLPLEAQSNLQSTNRETSTVGAAQETAAAVTAISDDEQAGEALVSATPEEDAEPSSRSFGPDDRLEALSSQLELSEEERDLMIRLARCAGDSPRRLLRFLNVYQVAKASLQTEHEPYELQLLMTQIAIGTGAPDLAEKWTLLLSKMHGPTLADAILKSVGENLKSEEKDQLERLTAAITILREKQPSMVAADLRRYSEMASRYSFTGGSLSSNLVKL